MQLKEKHSLLGVVIILLGFQAWDVHNTPEDPWQLLYLFNATMDYAMFAAILMLFQFSLKSKKTLYILFILWMQGFCVGLHFLALITEMEYRELGIEFLAKLNDGYTPTLEAIFWLKMLVLGWGGWSYQRSRKKHFGGLNDPWLVVVNPTVSSENSLREKIRY